MNLNYAHAGQTIAMRTSAGLTWLTSDQHGTAQNTIIALGQQVASTRRTLPFGEVRGETGTWPARLDKGFVGGTVDNTGLTHIGAREYDPKLGRFISVDPVMDLADPRQWNAYVYANNSPVSFSDPTGLYCDSCDYYKSKEPGYVKSEQSIGCGYSATGMCGPSGSAHSLEAYQKRWNQQYEWSFGTGDGSNQPIIYGHRLPTAEEMKRGPIFGAPVMMAPDETYADAVLNWAKYVCNSSNPGAGFCEWSYTIGNKPADGWDAVFVVIDAVGLAAGGVGGSALRGAAAPSKETGSLVKAVAASGRCEGGNSFVGDTQVLMADGSAKRIDDVRLGEYVLATDPVSGKSGHHEVTATIIGEGIKSLVEITVDKAGEIAGTERHPFWLPVEQQWADAKDLRVGSVLRTSAGAQAQITGIQKRVEIKRVYNLTVDSIHTYHVLAGDTPVLVHNCGVGRQLLGDKASAHILDNHAFPGAAGKSAFPQGWSNDDVLDAVAEVVTSPHSSRVWKTGSANWAEKTLRTRRGDPAVQQVVGVVRGVTIEVRYQPLTDEVLTAFPR